MHPLKPSKSHVEIPCFYKGSYKMYYCIWSPQYHASHGWQATMLVSWFSFKLSSVNSPCMREGRRPFYFSSWLTQFYHKELSKNIYKCSCGKIASGLWYSCTRAVVSKQLRTVLSWKCPYQEPSMSSYEMLGFTGGISVKNMLLNTENGEWSIHVFRLWEVSGEVVEVGESKVGRQQILTLLCYWLIF